MKKLTILFFLLFIFVHTTYAVVSLSPQSVNVIVDGKVSNVIKAYNVSEHMYLSLKEVAKLYKLNLEWKSVSLQVKIYFESGKTMIIKVNSTDVIFEKTIKKISSPPVLIKNDVFIPSEILELREFSKSCECNTKCNLSNLTLNISNRENILAVKHFTKPGSTQVIIQFDRALRYTISETPKTITLKILHGKIKNNSIDVHNGAIENIHYSTHGRFAVVKINLLQHSKAVKATKLLNSYGISINIVHSKNIDAENLVKAKIQADDEEEYVVLVDNLKTSDLTSPEKYGQAQISEFGYLTERDENDKNFESIPVTKFEQNDITDDSSTIVDDIAVTKDSSSRNVEKPSQKHQKIIVLDAGYGGKNCSVTTHNGIKEKNVNLEIVRNLKSIFEKNRKYKVILTKQDDIFVDFTERTNVANKYKADLFISVQCIVSQNEGFEVYCLSQKALDFRTTATPTLQKNLGETNNKKNSPSLNEMLGSMAANEYMNESLKLGGLILMAARTHNKFSGSGVENKDVKYANSHILKDVLMPAVLIKGTFCIKGSKSDLKKFQTTITQSIYDGVVKYYKYYAKKYTSE